VVHYFNLLLYRLYFAHAYGCICARNMEWSEVGDCAVDNDEERVFQNAAEEELTLYNGRLVVIVIELYRYCRCPY